MSDLLDDEKLTKMGLLVSQLRIRYSKILNEQINSNDREYQSLQEKLSIDENIIKKIREIKRRKVGKLLKISYIKGPRERRIQHST